MVVKKIKRIQESDIEILKGLYEMRVMSTEQIRRRYGLTEWYAYKKLARLRNTGWIITEPISGYRNKQRSQGMYHRINEVGISCLRDQGISVERKAHHQLPSKRHLPYVLLTNDLIIDLEPYDWTFKDSRTAKREYQLNRGDSFQAILRDPDGIEFLIYMLRENVTEPTLVKIQKEIETYSTINPVDGNRLTNNYMVFVQGQRSYQQVVDNFSRNKDALLTSRNLKLFPLSFAKKYLCVFYNNVKFMGFMQKQGMKDVTEEKLPQLRKKYKGLSHIVIHEGEEKYLVNLLDSDLVSIYNINQYRKEQYQLDGRKILAITTNSLAAEHMRMLQGIKHIEFYSIKHQEIFNYISEIESER